jgi:cell division protein FtsB
MTGRETLAEQVANRYQRVFQDGYDNAAQHWRPALMIGLGLVVALCSWEFIAGEHGVIALRHLKSDTDHLVAENATLLREVTDLRDQNHLISSDRFMAEKICREQLHMAFPGETVYFFKETPGDSKSDLPMTPDGVRIVQAPPVKDGASAHAVATRPVDTPHRAR